MHWTTQGEVDQVDRLAIISSQGPPLALLFLSIPVWDFPIHDHHRADGSFGEIDDGGGGFQCV